MLGAEREVIGEKKAGMGSGETFGMLQSEGSNHLASKTVPITAPATEQAAKWDGWNTALKPAVEPIIVARNPFSGTVAQCVLENGTGAINVDGCRVGTTGTTIDQYVATKTSTGSGVYAFNKGEAGDVTMNGDFTKQRMDGRWPANLIHDGSEEVVELFPQSQSSSAVQTRLPLRPGDSCPGEDKGSKECAPRVMGFDDSGSAARFFYTAKANEDDRPHGKGATAHPTVKPLDLMRYLVRLVCVKGGVVLDPFMGSGSTGCAAMEEGMRFVGIEQSREYADIAVGRLKLALRAPSAPPPTQKLRGT